MSESVLTCPFCGGAAHIVDDLITFYGQCDTCGATSAISSYRSGAIEAWNQRAQPAQEVPTGFKLLKDTTHDERSWPEDYRDENDCYCNICVNCLREFIGYKRRVICKVCDASQKGQS